MCEPSGTFVEQTTSLSSFSPDTLASGTESLSNDPPSANDSVIDFLSKELFPETGLDEPSSILEPHDSSESCSRNIMETSSDSFSFPLVTLTLASDSTEDKPTQEVNLSDPLPSSFVEFLEVTSEDEVLPSTSAPKTVCEDYFLPETSSDQNSFSYEGDQIQDFISDQTHLGKRKYEEEEELEVFYFRLGPIWDFFRYRKLKFSLEDLFSNMYL